MNPTSTAFNECARKDRKPTHMLVEYYFAEVHLELYCSTVARFVGLSEYQNIILEIKYDIEHIFYLARESKKLLF